MNAKSLIMAHVAASQLGYILANDEQSTNMLLTLVSYMDEQANKIKELEKEVSDLYEDAAG